MGAIRMRPRRRGVQTCARRMAVPELKERIKDDGCVEENTRVRCCDDETERGMIFAYKFSTTTKCDTVDAMVAMLVVFIYGGRDFTGRICGVRTADW